MERKIKYGLTHCHTENSLKDSPLSATDLVKTARSMGAPAVFLTDHGYMTGIFEFLAAVEKVNKDPKDPWHGIYNMKAIPGVEAYVKDPGISGRRHLVLVAKDYIGYKAICRAVTKSNTNVHNERPCMSGEILREFFGPGTAGHGHVIATSACVGGVLAQILLSNNVTESEISKLEKKQAKYGSPEDPSYKGNLALMDRYHAEVDALIAQRDELKKKSEVKFGRWEKVVAKMTGAEREAAEAELAEKKQARDKAAEDLVVVKSNLAKAKRKETNVRQICREMEKDHERWSYYQHEIEVLKTALEDPIELYAKAKRFAAEYDKLFGSGNFYVELQYHGIRDEAFAMPLLAQLAKELSLPVVAANDVHYATNSPEDIRARALVNAMRYNKWNPEQEGDREYYAKSDGELQEWLCKILPEDVVRAAMQGIADMVAACDVVFPGNTHFPKFAGGEPGETAKERLRRLTEEGIKAKYPEGAFKHRDRVEYELSIIDKMQYNDYLCIVQDFLSFARQKGVECPEGVGYVIGPGRGSAAGSLVCYLIGITSVDPMPLNLLFERFLNPDRISSPDIDVDLAYEVREKTLDYVRQKYGEEAVCCITTKGTLAARNAIKSVARVRGSELRDDKMAFYDLGNALAKMIPAKDTKAKIRNYEEAMRMEFKDNPDALAIIDDAKLVEGVAINYGMHAAGVIIADNGDVGDYISLLWNADKERWCSQCDMVEAEKQAGLLKFDFLGLRNLDIITEALRLIKRNTGKSIDIENVPQESEIYREIFAAGKTDFIFQFASDGMKNLLRKFKPENLEHLILLNAVFRPGPLQYADAICETKAGKKKPSYVCKEAKDILSVTYGYPVFQEQVMQICNKIAGFTLGEADTVRRYMSKKNEEELAKFQPKFVTGLINKGVEAARAEAFWVELMEFAKYGFNKSHAAVYATIAYYTAWLKYHYPTEYMTAVLNNTSIDELPAMIKECRDLGLKVVAPDINSSEENFTGKEGRIQFGLGNIKSVGKGASLILTDRETHGTYRSFKDLLSRVRPDKGVCEALIDAGAFDCWCDNRIAMKTVLKDWLDDVKKVREKNETIEEIKLAMAASTEDTDEAELKKLEKRLDNAIAKRDEYQFRFDCAVLPIGLPEDKTERLAKESELLGMYISGHPIDEYPEAFKIRTSSIAEANAEARYATFCGVIRNAVVKKRKKDGAPMAFFTIEDESGSAEGCCFTAAYEMFGSLIVDNAVVSVMGRLTIDEDDETGKITKKITIEELAVLQPKPKTILIVIRDLAAWTDYIYDQVVSYSSESGARTMLYDLSLGEFRETNLHLSRDIMLAEIEDADIKEVDI